MPSKFIPALTLAAMLAASGAVIVSAQTAPTDGAAAPEAPVAPAPGNEAPAARGGFMGLGGHGGRGGPGGGDLLRGVLTQADADADGAVTQEEVDAARASLVGGADASGEGDLSLKEFETVYLQLVRAQMVDAFQDLDEDGDAQVTAAELDTRLSGVVARMDQDGDGALSQADRPQRGDEGGFGGHGRRG